MSGRKGSAVVGSVAPLRRAGGAFHVSANSYIAEAERLLERSRRESQWVEGITWSYRAALRGAGAVIEDARSGRRRRSAGSAWARLRSSAPELGEWADRFEVYARFVSRVEMGLEASVQKADAENLYADVCEFLDEVRGKVGYLPEVA